MKVTNGTLHILHLEDNQYDSEIIAATLKKTGLAAEIEVARDRREFLSAIENQSFDVVLQIDTLQHLRNAEVMLRETVRVGRMGILAFPNFAHWPNRLSVLQGRMPVTKRLPYEWYDTPNIRVGTYADFAQLARKNKLRVLDSFGLHLGQVVRTLPNLRAGTAVFKLQR